MEGEDLEVGGGGDAKIGFLMGAGIGAGLVTGEPLPPPPPHLNLLQSTGRAASEEHCLADL